MIELLVFVLAILVSPFSSKFRLEAENAVLRHQLMVLRRKMQGRPHLTNNDRCFFPDVSMAPVHLKGCCDHTPRDACALVVPTVGLDLLYAFVIVRLDRRGLERI